VERDARLHRLHARVEVVDVDLEELAVRGIGSASSGLPDRSASTPMTNGIWIFFSEP
jgi:hypothetical protein